MEQEAEWRSLENGGLSGSQQEASVFVVRDGLVVSVARYPALVDALRAADIEESYEVPVDHRPRARGSGGAVGEP